MRKLLAVTVLLLAACNGASSRGEKLLAGGKFTQAEKLLLTHLADDPDDERARLLLGRVLLRQRETERAGYEFEKLDHTWHKRVAKVYREELDLARLSADDQVVAQYARGIVRYNGKATLALCNELLEVARDRRSGDRQYAQVMVVAGTIDSSCRSETLKTLRTWIGETPATDSGEAESLAKAAVRIDPEATNDVALALRDLALKYERDGSRSRASSLLEAAVELDPSISDELETVVLRSRLAGRATDDSRPRVEMSGVTPDTLYEGGDAMEISKRVIRVIATAVEAYATDVNRYPPASSPHELERYLVPTYAPSIPWSDGWGTPMAYATDRAGQSYRIVSGGPDRRIHDSSTRVGAEGSSTDLIWENGAFVNVPPGAGVPFHVGARP
jgi:tetratricopeptide (TPR) repeat protein